MTKDVDQVAREKFRSGYGATFSRWVWTRVFVTVGAKIKKGKPNQNDVADQLWLSQSNVSRGIKSGSLSNGVLAICASHLDLTIGQNSQLPDDHWPKDDKNGQDAAVFLGLFYATIVVALEEDIELPGQWYKNQPEKFSDLVIPKDNGYFRLDPKFRADFYEFYYYGFQPTHRDLKALEGKNDWRAAFVVAFRATEMWHNLFVEKPTL